MNDNEKYLFDLNGYIIIRDVLDQNEIDEANKAIDHYSNEIK